MKPIILSSRQRQGIERRCKRTLDSRLYQRLTGLLAVAAGHTPEDVAGLLGVDDSQLSHWLQVFLNGGLEALCTLGEGEPSPSHD